MTHEQFLDVINFLFIVSALYVIREFIRTLKKDPPNDKLEWLIATIILFFPVTLVIILMVNIIR